MLTLPENISFVKMKEKKTRWKRRKTITVTSHSHSWNREVSPVSQYKGIRVTVEYVEGVGPAQFSRYRRRVMVEYVVGVGLAQFSRYRRRVMVEYVEGVGPAQFSWERWRPEGDGEVCGQRGSSPVL
jgi:hypothetical protein